MAKNKRTSDDRRKKLQELVEERNQDANSFFSGNENVTRENIGQKRKEDSNNFKKESSKRKNISSSSSQKSNYSNYTNNSNDNDYELPMINNNENRFQLPTVNRPQMPTMNFQSRARRNSSFTGINLDENNLKYKQKETSRKVFETLNPGKKISYKNEQPNLRNKADLIRDILTTGTSISKGENAGKLVNNILTTTQNLGTSAYTGLLQFGKVLNERLADNQNMRIKADNILTDNTKDKQKAKNLLKGQADLLGLNYNEEKNKIEELKYEDVNKKIQSKINEENNNTAKRIEESTGLGKTTAELASSLGNNLVGMVGSAANPGLGLTYFVGSATGSYEDDAKERGMTEDKAKLYSGIMGAFEGVGDYVFGFGALNKGLSAVGRKSIGKAVSSIGETLLGSGLENAFQEGITEPINELVATAVGGRDKADWQNIEQRILKSAGYGFLSGLIFDGIGRGAGSITNIQNKLNNGENISQVDVKNVVKDLESTGMTREEILNNARNNAIESVKTEINRTNNQEQAKRDITERINNSNLSEEDKSNMLDYVENEDFTQADYNAMRETIENSEQPTDTISQEQISSLVGRIDKSNLSNEDKLQMKEYINNNIVSQADVEAMNRVIDEAVTLPASNELVTNQNFKDNVEARRKYAKYKNDTGEYNSKVIDEVLDTIPENRNGNRTVKQWLQVAKETGTRIADLSNEEIERIAYKSWFDVQPSKNITKYDRQTKSTVGFQKLTSDEWVNEINKAVNEARSNRQVQENTNNTENNKQKQLDIIQENNPMTDNYHTGIRNIEDIKTFDEVINDEESFVYGDFSKEDAENALKEGKVTVYSSNPIEQGSFVSTSQNMAKDYAGNGKIYSQEVDLKDVAWINGDEGQYAKVENNLTNNQKNIVNNSKKVYNIINKSITNNERAQVSDEVRRWRINQENGLGYIDLSEKGYNSYIYNKQGGNVETILKVNGSEEFKNYIRKGVEDGTFSNAEGFNKSIAEIKNEYRKYRSSNDSMSGRKSNNRNDKLPTRQIRREGSSNTARDIKQNSGNESIENSNKSSFIMPTAENINENNTQNTKGESINWNEIERPEGKFRKHYQSIIQSSNTTAQAKAIARELMEADTYIPESNKNQLQRADERIQTNGADKELTTLSTNVDNGSKITSVDIAVGERLIEYYSKIGNKAKLQEAIQTTAMAGTQAGQTVQALALLNHQTPQGQVTWIQRSVDKLNKELKHKKGDKAKQFEFTPEMQQKILKAKDNQEMNNVIDEVYQELGQQVPKSFIEKLDSWRYFSMLANPRTHIRNIVGNFAMGKMQGVKNKVAGAIEDTMSLVNKDMERTHTLKRASKETKQFAKNDLNNVDIQTRLELNENKYNPKSRIENSQRTFKSDALEKTIGKAFSFNDTALEAEDGFGLKHAYVKALSEYMSANKLTPETITEKQLAKARNHAIEEAKEATFHSKNAIATAINQFSKKNKLTKFGTDAVLPFVKTPLNVAKAGLEYNPTGLIKTLTVDSVKLRKGKISINKYIDNLSKGLTGTGLAVLGYAMAKAGILKASGGDDDKKEKYDEALGRQAYSLEINGKTFSLDWLAPAGIPLFVGAEAQNIKSQGENEKKSISSDDDSKSKQIIESLENWANAMSNSISPMSEMSMISGLTSALKSYDNDNQKMLGTIGTNNIKSYVNQFVPTALGQLARTTDEYERNTTSTKTGVLSKPIDQVKLQVMSKVPGLRQKLPTKSDIWGNEVKQQANIPFRAFNNFVNPSIIKDVSINEVDKELNSLYSKTGESSIIPKSTDKTFTIDGENYRMTNEEYAKYNKKYGETSYNLIKGLVTSNDYKNLTDEQKQKAIESVYSYAKEQNKVDYAKENNKEIKQSTLYETMKALKSKGGNQSNYLEFISKTSGADIKERQKVNTLYNADYDKNTKDIIYSNTIGKDDEIYNKVKKDNVSINSYLKYKDAIYNETDKKRDSGELEKEQNLKSADKIKILLNSNFSENEKKSLYSNAVADDDVYSKLLKENINVDEYLNFKKAQLNEKLASDKDKYGQAIRGTSKEKFFKYINSKISGYENRLIIAGKNYKLSNKERQKLVNIINSNTEEGKERINMYKNFSRNFIVNGNNVFYK